MKQTFSTTTTTRNKKRYFIHFNPSNTILSTYLHMSTYILSIYVNLVDNTKSGTKIHHVVVKVGLLPSYLCFCFFLK